MRWLEPAQREEVLRILGTHVPHLDVWAFGSRVHGRGIKPFSDLDLVLVDQQPLPPLVMAQLREAFSDSLLPFRVDLVEWAGMDEGFRDIIRGEHEVLQRARGSVATLAAKEPAADRGERCSGRIMIQWARDAWRAGDFLRAGHILHHHLPRECRPIWAARVLAAACSTVTPPREVQHVLEVAADAQRWKEGHDAFAAVRALTLEQEKAGHRRDAVLLSLLHLAENAAKVTFNSSGAPAPFDEDSGDWIVPNAKALLELAANPALEESLETAIFSEV